MATYYRWNKSNFTKGTTNYGQSLVQLFNGQIGTYLYASTCKEEADGGYSVSAVYELTVSQHMTFTDAVYVSTSRPSIGHRPSAVYSSSTTTATVRVEYDRNGYAVVQIYGSSTANLFKIVPSQEFIEYVYSLNSSAYPNNATSGSFYYSGRTTITSPTAPSSISYPATITTPRITVSWTASASLVPSYSVNYYLLEYSKNGESWVTQGGNGPGTSQQFVIPPGTTSIQFRVRARDSNNQWGAYTTGTVSQVVQAPTLTVPEMVMQGQSATVSWSEVEGADSYTLERKSSADADWTQVYSGDSLSFTETVGTWTSLQYRVCAVFGESATGWAASGEIQIVAASALVISGSDGDLGTLTSDVSYSVSSDQTSPVIEVTVAVNGGEYAAFQAVSGQNYRIGVLDLPTGTGSIVITASMEVGNSPATVTRTWTYTKAAQSFPHTGSVARLTQEGDTIWPQTLAEAVRTTGGPWGGDLSKALNLLQRAAVYHRTSVPKYSEVSIDLSTATVGQEINLPVNGVMTPHIVVHIGNPDPELYDASCDGVWLLRKDIVENGQWNASNVNTLAGSTIMTTMQGYVDDYDETVQAAIKTVKIPYCVGGGDTTVNSGANGLECKMFPLGGKEVGFPASQLDVPTDGAKLDYFILGLTGDANNRRLAYLNGSPAIWMLRSPGNNDSSTYVYIIGPQGNMAGAACTDSFGMRPCFLLPTIISATYYVDSNGGIHPSQEHTAAGDFSDLWGNDIPTVKIETGSYTGTGIGVAYPTEGFNTLTFSFEPKVLIITGRLSTSEGRFYSQTAVINCDEQFFTCVFPAQAKTTSMSLSAAACYLVKEGNMLKWWMDSDGNTGTTRPSDASVQLNVSGVTYKYIAIG